ncbi:MAG: hypothetical protein JWO58_1174 [Chitinophagaceae bacterium]|nr:hypothetical protein [Chitinophagaceae bacterium]
MAQQRGLIKLDGSIDGMTFYRSNGMDLVRSTYGPDKQTIQTHPNYVRVRENNQEFGGSSVIAKALRAGWGAVYRHMAVGATTFRTVGLIRKILGRGEGIRGQRIFDPVRLASMLMNFSFSKTAAYDRICLVPYQAIVNAERNEVTFLFSDVDTHRMIVAPQGATHFRLINLVSVLSTYAYQQTTSRYEPTEAAYNSKSSCNTSDYIPLLGSTGAFAIVSAIDTVMTMLPADSALISTIGIEFYEDLNGMKYLFSSGHAMKVQAVY